MDVEDQMKTKLGGKILNAVLGEKGEGKRWKKAGKFAKKAASVAATSLSHGLDAVYGTGKIAANPTIFAKDKEKEKNSNKDGDFDPTTNE